MPATLGTDQLDLRDIRSGNKDSLRFKRARWSNAFLEQRDYTYLFNDGDNYTFMDVNTYEQIPVSADILGDSAPFLQEGMKVDRILRNRSPERRTAANSHLHDHGDRARREGPDRRFLLQARNSEQHTA